MRTIVLCAWLVCALCAGSAVSAPEAKKLLPFQGRLTDASGNRVGDGAKVVQFKIYDAPVGGTTVWGERGRN